MALLPLGLGFLWMFFDARKRGLHDVIAGTMVARTAAPPRPAARDAAASVAPGAASRAGAERVPVPRIFPGGFGPWGRAAAPEGHASLLWIRDDVLFIAEVDRQNHPGAMAAVAAGDPFPGRAVPLGALHSVAGLADAADAEITFAVEDGGSETMAAALASPAERDELMGALLTRMGSGWARMVEREARGPLLWEGLKAAAAILLVTVVILGVISTGNVDSLQTEGRSGLVLAVLVLLGMLAGAEWVIGIAGVLTGLCALYMIAVVAAPPERVALRRAVGARDASEAHPRAVYG
ncbi:MAG TPA: hypothetical protein VEQ60_07375 [Longimicrobium sp.]|nr:hypothetical protein [Longimicrobium sp.]